MNILNTIFGGWYIINNSGKDGGKNNKRLHMKKSIGECLCIWGCILALELFIGAILFIACAILPKL